jgi:hypothetical protein
MQEFTGKLEEISPKKIISKDESNDFDNFFLVLGLIYNDLKDLIFFLDLINKTYDRPTMDGTEEPSVHLDEWGGIQNHMNRLMISFMSEFLSFLDKNKKVMGTIRFQLLEKSLPKNIKNDWFKIVQVTGDEKENNFILNMKKIRNKVSFHFDLSLKELRTGFINKFYIAPKDKYNKEAFYSLGGSMETSRFFYCDGAVEEYLKEHMKASSEENYFKNIRDLVERTNMVILFMMKEYINSKK